MRLAAFLLCATLTAAEQRLVTIGTSLTETVYALGAGASLVATDNSSHDDIPQTKPLPTVGAFRAGSPEAIL